MSELKAVTTKLIKLSLCHCGFAMLDDSIPLGAEYLVYPQSARPEEPWGLICGKCGCITRGKGNIQAHPYGDPNSFPAPLPLELLEISLDYIQEVEVGNDGTRV